DVVAVVVEHPRERRRPARAEEVEVERGDQGARHVVLALEPEDLALERREPAVGATRRENAAGRPEEVEVGQSRGPAAAREDEARLEERQVEGRAVEGDDSRGLLEERHQRGEQRGLLVEVAQEVLLDNEPGAGGGARRATASPRVSRPARAAAPEPSPWPSSRPR